MRRAPPLNLRPLGDERVPARWPSCRDEDSSETEAYDLAWMPAPFLPRRVLDAGVPMVARALRPGGWLVLGRYAAPNDALPAALADLRTIRGGGTPLSEEDAVALLEGDLEKAHVVPSDWNAPIRFVAGRRPR